MSKAEDLIGRRFGLLAVIGRAGNTAAGRARWQCRCDCGRAATVDAAYLKSSATRSCGCLKQAQRKTAARRQCHPYSRAVMPSERKTWENMLARCDNPGHKSFSRYGGRGIGVCTRWRESFQAFADDMGPRPSGYTIDRRDPGGDYAPGNCRWATRAEQANNRSNNRLLAHAGETLTIAQWAERTGLSHGCIHQRIKRGWPVHRALTQSR